MQEEEMTNIYIQNELPHSFCTCVCFSNAVSSFRLRFKLPSTQVNQTAREIKNNQIRITKLAVGFVLFLSMLYLFDLALGICSC